MIIITILLGLFGLGIVIIVHEYGHLLAARLSGIEVEAFAVGWGKTLKQFTHKNTQYKLNLFPVGGYCKLKGEEAFRKALENKYSTFPKEPGSLFSVSPVRRFLTYAAGPVFNLIFAVILFSSVWAIGYEYPTYSNRIILVSEFPILSGNDVSQENPAAKAGLQSGDYITRIGNNPISNFSDIQDALITNAEKELSLVYQREGTEYSTIIIPEMDRRTGSGIIGIYAWIDPIIKSFPPGSPEEAAGFQVGDLIKSVGNEPVTHALGFYNSISQSISNTVEVTVERENRETVLTYIPAENDDGNVSIQFGFPSLTITNKAESLIDALGKGIKEMASTFSLTFKSIGMLFKGLELEEAMAGPIKITYLVGEAAAAGFRQSFVTGIRTLLQLLGFISVALGFANLLPIPALDGGQMVLAAAEGLTRRQISPRKYYILQIVGFGILFTLLFFTVFNDLRYFLG